MREEQVANGVNFLVHPKVKTAPLSQRISFLENKVCDGDTPEITAGSGFHSYRPTSISY